MATRLHILNNAKTPPFQVEDEVTASEETRLRYRYLDLRRPRPQRNIELRHRILFEMRKALDELGFFEIETPMLTRSTPEGARDYLVPSRVHHGQFYALPQSPQIFKQILMISGMDRYFQIVRCFRDEDLRADRQPEFTQLDLEMSFPRQQDIFEVIERVMDARLRGGRRASEGPFRHMDYKDALRRYGSDKPDLRFGMELQDVTAAFRAGARDDAHSKGTCRRWSRRARRLVAQAARRAGRGSEVSGRARRLHRESHRRRNHFAARKKSRRGWAEEIRRSGRRESRRFDCRRGRERTNSRTPILRWVWPGQVRLYLGDKLNLIDRSQMGIFLDHRLRALRMERERQALGQRAASRSPGSSRRISTSSKPRRGNAARRATTWC